MKPQPNKKPPIVPISVWEAFCVVNVRRVRYEKNRFGEPCPWNTIYMDAVLDQLRAEGYVARPEDEARLSPFGHEHINMLGRYSFAVPEAVARGELRPLRNAMEA
jgi:hypothetical protein